MTFFFDRTTNFVLDLGGVAEFYPTKRTFLRFDAGDVLLFYGTRSLTVGVAQGNLPGGPHQDSMQFSVGYGWRF